MQNVFSVGSSAGKYVWVGQRKREKERERCSVSHAVGEEWLNLNKSVALIVCYDELRVLW